MDVRRLTFKVPAERHPGPGLSHEPGVEPEPVGNEIKFPRHGAPGWCSLRPTEY